VLVPGRRLSIRCFALRSRGPQRDEKNNHDQYSRSELAVHEHASAKCRMKEKRM
jgi:hypothetical protein